MKRVLGLEPVPSNSPESVTAFMKSEVLAAVLAATRDGEADVALTVGVVRHPPTGARVVERLGRLLATVAAALPGKQRPAQAGGRRGDQREE
jgi:hypothetical protein